jgi:two-component system, NarL family, sensor histidine kinase UhpB
MKEMKKIIPLLVCFCCFLAFSYGQNTKIDSMLQVLKISKEDTAKVNTLNRLATELMSYSPDTAIYFTEQAKALSIKLNYKMGIATSNLQIGIALTHLGNYEEALNACNNALELYNELLPASDRSDSRTGRPKILKQIANTYNTIGINYDHQGKYPDALKNFLESLKISEEVGNKSTIAATYNNIGIIYCKQGNYPEAMKNILASLQLEEESGNKIGIVNDYTNIGLIYESLGKYSEASENFFLALKISTEIADKQLIANSHNNIGVNYYNQGNYSEALENYSAALKVSEETGNIQMVANSLLNIGQIYVEQGNYPIALKNFLASLEVCEKIGDSQGIGMAYGSIGLVYWKQHKYNEASEYVKKGLGISKDIGDVGNIKYSYLLLAELDSAQGNYKNSLKHYKFFITIRDSLNNLDVSQKITQLQMQYEFDKKEALAQHEQEEKDTLAHKELQRQKLIRDFALGTIGLVLVLFFFIYRSYRARQALRLNDIRNRIAGDLHDDIGSTLNSISIYSEVARKKDENYDEALEMIGDASRKIIEAMSDIVWTINAENDSFEKIIFRMKSLAYNLFRAKKIEFTFHADEILDEKKLSLEERRNFYLIFKEAVNNMVKYANATRAAITLTYENNRIRLRIQDNGVGFDISQQNAGNGLKNMKRRADEMKAGFKIESQPGSGTQIELILKV